MVENQLKYFLDTNFNDDDKFLLIQTNGLSAIMEKYYDNYPLHIYAEKIQSNNRVINLVKRHYMCKLLKDFNDQNVPILYFKGELLQQKLFNDITLRPVGDIDLYTYPKQFDTAMDILKNHDFLFRNRNTIKSNHHIQYIKGHVKLELHRNLFNPVVKIDEHLILTNVVSHCYNGYQCLVFNETAYFLYLLYHLYMDTFIANCSFASVMEKNVTMAKRFILRSFEIAKYVQIYYNQIQWEMIKDDIEKQILTKDFYNLIMMMEYIYPDIIPKSITTLTQKKLFIDK